MREIIVDRENGAKAFVLFELTKGNIAEIKDRYILEQLRSAIDSPWSTALPDGIRSALTRSVSEEISECTWALKPKVIELIEKHPKCLMASKKDFTYQSEE